MTMFHSTTARLLLASLLLVSAVLCWEAATTADAIALRHERIATLQEGDPGADAGTGWPRTAVAALDADAGLHAATEAYWAARYEALTATDPAGDPDDAWLPLLRANATFRLEQRRAGGRAMSVERLEQAVQAYAGVLRGSGFSRDAAYNYEYVARVRDGVARARSATRPSVGAPSTAAAIVPDDLPAGPTVHGRPGHHPPPTRGDQFEILTPMDYGDREAQPEPTPGKRLPRKG